MQCAPCIVVEMSSSLASNHFKNMATRYFEKNLSQGFAASKRHKQCKWFLSCGNMDGGLTCRWEHVCWRLESDSKLNMSQTYTWPPPALYSRYSAINKHIYESSNATSKSALQRKWWPRVSSGFPWFLLPYLTWWTPTQGLHFHLFTRWRLIAHSTGLKSNQSEWIMSFCQLHYKYRLDHYIFN